MSSLMESKVENKLRPNKLMMGIKLRAIEEKEYSTLDIHNNPLHINGDLITRSKTKMIKKNS